MKKWLVLLFVSAAIARAGDTVNYAPPLSAQNFARAEKIRALGPQIGMTASDCEIAWGKPTNVNPYATARGTQEQWCYDHGYVYLEQGIVVKVQHVDRVTTRSAVVATPATASAIVVSSSMPAPTATPSFPISPTIADLRIGITEEQCRLILGNPRTTNGDQWVYPRGYIYMRDGKVESMQNKSGGVFAAAWK